MAQLVLAIFDLDYTLLDGDCEMLWSRFLRQENIVDDHFLGLIDRYYQDYEAGQLDVYEYEAFLLYPLRYLATARLLRLRNGFVRSLRAHFRPQMLARVERHRSAGHDLLLITTTNHILARPVAAYLGFSNLICTQVERKTPSLAWRVKGTPAFREGKVQLLRDWLASEQQSLADSWGYSDSYNDIPLLSLVDHPVAVTPDKLLREHASRSGWEVIQLGLS
jgi:HAD superfamily hydrolase (TIGR01490 family)